MDLLKTGLKATFVAVMFSIASEAHAVIADAPKPSVVFEEDFSLFPAIEPWQGKRYGIFGQDETLKDEFFHTPGWKGWYISYGQFAGVAHFEYDDETDTGYIQTPPVNLTADNGKVTIKVEYRRDSWEGMKTTDDNIHIQLRNRANGTDTGITGIFSKEGTAEVNTEWGTYTVTLNGGTADCSVRIWGGSYTGDIRKIQILQVLPEVEVPVADTFSDFTGESFTANWRSVKDADTYLLSVFEDEGMGRQYIFSDKEVTGTSFNVTGLDPMRIYSYSVKARIKGNTSEESNVIRCFGIPRPLKPQISNISVDGFNVSWDEPYNANIYQLETSLIHTATADERYCLLSEDFLNTPNQDADPDNAVKGESSVYLDDYMNRANYIVTCPLFAADCLSLDNTFASMGIYGELDGPTMDLSADDGKVTVELRVRALNAASMGLYMLNYVERVNQFTSDKIVDRIELWDNEQLEPLTTEWVNRTFTLTGGNEKSYIAIQAYGYGAIVQIDHISIYQNLKSGETIRVPYRSTVTSDTEINILTNKEGFSESKDKFECTLKAAYVPANDGDITYSDWSEPASFNIPGENAGIDRVQVETAISVTNDGRTIKILNPGKAAVTVFNVSGIPVANTDAESFQTPELPAGLYFISAPATKTTKLLLK